MGGGGGNITFATLTQQTKSIACFRNIRERNISLQWACIRTILPFKHIEHALRYTANGTLVTATCSLFELGSLRVQEASLIAQPNQQTDVSWCRGKGEEQMLNMHKCFWREFSGEHDLPGRQLDIALLLRNLHQIALAEQISGSRKIERKVLILCRQRTQRSDMLALLVNQPASIVGPGRGSIEPDDTDLHNGSMLTTLTISKRCQPRYPGSRGYCCSPTDFVRSSSRRGWAIRL